MKNNIKIKACKESPYRGEGIELYIVEQRDSLITHVAKPIEMIPIDDRIPGEPSLRLDNGSAHELMNVLWDCGIRPTAAKGSAGQLEAVKYHLEDMRKLVFKNSQEG